MASPNNTCQLLIIIALIALSVAISLLLRYLHRSSSEQTSGESLHRIAPQDDSNPLPLFTFSSLTGTLAVAGDCAVCLSKFNPEDKLRLLPLCCHAFHAECIDTWISAGQTCPLCRSPIYATESELLSKIRSLSVPPPSSRSFRVEIGSVSRRLPASDSGNLNLRRSFSIGDFEYVIDDALPEIAVPSAQLAAAVGEKREGEGLAAEVAGGGERGRSGWLMDYVERMARTASFSLSSSFRSSGRFCFVGSSRRTDVPRVHELDLEASQLGDEIAEAFSWLSPV